MNQNWRPSAGVEMLRARAALLHDIRAYFLQHNVMEVETPVLSNAGVTDPNINSMRLSLQGQADRFLHTSPEFPMKRLLCADSGDIYQISKVFRSAELGRNHNPEFTLLEWYRLNYDHHDLMQEVDSLLHALFPGELALPRSRFLSYADAILNATGKPLEEFDAAAVRQVLHERGIEPPDSLGEAIDPWLDMLMSFVVAPAFDSNSLTFLYDYPVSQAALAKISRDSPEVAERFEVYFGELELANGFHELQNAEEQRARFENDNSVRAAQSMEQIPLDDNLIDALTSGLPACAGVALGIDRLLMAFYQKSDIKEVISFDYNHA